jgi:uncharacterized membrane protein YfcA
VIRVLLLVLAGVIVGAVSAVAAALPFEVLLVLVALMLISVAVQGVLSDRRAARRSS